jgi:uncharacterized protein (TIGR00290 family)
MDTKKKISISWSGGKDSALMLHKILSEGQYEIAHLHTVINQETKRVGMHGVPEALVQQQADAIGLPLVKLYLHPSESHAEYEKILRGYYLECIRDGISVIAFGDIFLEDLKAYREKILKEFGIEPAFPLWQYNTTELMRDFLATGFKTLICSANKLHLSEQQLGKVIDESFVKNLPPAVDPCGENGEFHTFVFDAPYFKKPIAFQLGEVVLRHYEYQKETEGKIEKLRTSFWFQELLP